MKRCLSVAFPAIDHHALQAPRIRRTAWRGNAADVAGEMGLGTSYGKLFALEARGLLRCRAVPRTGVAVTETKRPTNDRQSFILRSRERGMPS